MNSTTEPPVAALLDDPVLGDVVVQPMDVDDDEQVAQAHRASVASARFERPWAKVASLHEFTIDLRKPGQSERLEPLVGLVDGQVAGVAKLWFPLLDNTNFVWFELDVDPAQRRRGVGGALVERAVERTREDGRTTILAEFNVPDEHREDHAHVRFARGYGFTYANTEIARTLDLPVAPELLTRLAAESAERHAGYRIESYVGSLPIELRQSYCDCFNQLAVDAPTGEVEFEEESRTPEIYAEDLGRLEQQGRTMVHTVAIAPGGEVVGYNDLVVRADAPEDVMQWGTLVRGEHRGHRLGMAVKVRGLQELARIAPGAKQIRTCNAEQNSHMVSVNVDLGFRKVEAVVAYQRHLTS